MTSGSLGSGYPRKAPLRFGGVNCVGARQWCSLSTAYQEIKKRNSVILDIGVQSRYLACVASLSRAEHTHVDQQFVVSLPAAEESALAILRALAAIPVFTLGGGRHRVACRFGSPDGSTARYWHEWVEQLPGVIQVEVAFVSFMNLRLGQVD